MCRWLPVRRSSPTSCHPAWMELKKRRRATPQWRAKNPTPPRSGLNSGRFSKERRFSPGETEYTKIALFIRHALQISNTFIFRLWCICVCVHIQLWLWSCAFCITTLARTPPKFSPTSDFSSSTRSLWCTLHSQSPSSHVHNYILTLYIPILIILWLAVPLEMPVLRKETFNVWYSLRPYYLAMSLSDLPFQVKSIGARKKMEL